MIAFAHGWRIEPGTRGDYLVLGRHHYASGEPATYAHVLRAVDDGRTVGVLVVSRPTLNAAWRRLAWPDALAGLDKRATAAWVNAHLRTISRVVVEPRWRGTGVARSLVRAYLDDPLTAHTEAVAAMAGVSPFFERAGMRRVDRAMTRRDRALRRVLRDAGIRAWELLDLRAARTWCERSPPVRAELRRWAKSSRGTRGLVNGPEAILAARAGASLSARPVALVYP